MLEDHSHRALVGRYVSYVLSIDDDFSLGGHFKTGNHTQSGCFTTTAGSKKGNQLAFGNLQVEIFHGSGFAESFTDVVYIKESIITSFN